MIRYEAFISKNWRDTGLAQLIVARIRDGGRAEIGFFLVDHWCLGVKDAFLIDDGSEVEFRELLRERLPEEFRERLHPACAKKMIEGAAAYAETLGFAPARDYRKAKRVLSGLTAADCPESFTYVRDEKPFYVEGPNDTPDRTDRVLAMLTKRFGADGFGYELFSDDPDDDDLDDEEGTGADPFEARESLRLFFEDAGETDSAFHQFTGMVAALHICPNLVSPNELVARFWGPDGRTWSDKDELADFMADLAAYWNYIANLYAVYQGPKGDEDLATPIDISPDDFPGANKTAQLAQMGGAIMDWCDGFLRTTREWPAAWSDALDRADLKPHWALIRAWSDPEGDPKNLAIISGTNDPGASAHPSSGTRRLPRAIIVLLRALRPPQVPLDKY